MVDGPSTELVDHRFFSGSSAGGFGEAWPRGFDEGGIVLKSTAVDKQEQLNNFISKKIDIVGQSMLDLDTHAAKTRSSLLAKAQANESSQQVAMQKLSELIELLSGTISGSETHRKREDVRPVQSGSSPNRASTAESMTASAVPSSGGGNGVERAAALGAQAKKGELAAKARIAELSKKLAAETAARHAAEEAVISHVISVETAAAEAVMALQGRSPRSPRSCGVPIAPTAGTPLLPPARTQSRQVALSPALSPAQARARSALLARTPPVPERNNGDDEDDFQDADIASPDDVGLIT